MTKSKADNSSKPMRFHTADASNTREANNASNISDTGPEQQRKTIPPGYDMFNIKL